MINIIIIVAEILVVIGAITFFVHLFIKAINKDQQEQDERILVLEKRIQEQYEDFNDTIKDFKNEIINLNIEQSDLEKRIQKLERKKKSDNK